MTRSRVALAAASLLLAVGALWVPAAGAQTPSPSPSPSGSAAPSPSGSAAPSSSASGSSVTSAPEEEALAVLLGAEPATVELGDEGVIVGQVTNTGDAELSSVSLDVTLPPELELVEAFPVPVTSTGGTLSFELGPLEPGDSAVVQITVRGLEVVPAATVTAVATGGGTSASDAVDVAIVVTGGAGGLKVSSRTERVLAQVGSSLRYVVTVRNDGSEDLEDVLVVDVAPREVEVVSVDIVDEVEAVQIGESRGRFDVVWNVGSLPAGASVELPWEGRAVRAGDLTAVNSVRGLLGQTETVRSTSRSFLASEGDRAVENPPFDPIEKRVVKLVEPDPGVQPSARATTPPIVVLPLTGIAVSRLAFAAAMFVFAGMLLLGGARLAPAGSAKAVAGAALAGLVLVACVSGGDDSAGSARSAAPRTAGTDDPRDEDARVKGERIVRGGGDASPAPTPAPETEPPAATPAPATPPTEPPPANTAEPGSVAAPATAPPATAPAASDPEPARVVEVVRIGLEDLPVETLASRGGDNTVSFGWDEGAGITSASSGTRGAQGRGSDLLTDLTTATGAIVNRVTLTNTHDDVRLDVEGRLVHEVYSGGRLVARLRSAPLDTILSPGGSVSARFEFLLPTGDYVVESSFESSQ